MKESELPNQIEDALNNVINQRKTILQVSIGQYCM